MQHFIVAQIYYLPELEKEMPEPIEESALVIYQYRGDDMSEPAIEADIRKNLHNVEVRDTIRIRGEIVDPTTLQVLKRWNKRCLDEGGGLFYEGTFET